MIPADMNKIHHIDIRWVCQNFLFFPGCRSGTKKLKQIISLAP
jgi:hypothetical protein